ncbi:MAG: hypothetical protein ACP5QT_08155 [Brevinematia bacterium]
MKKKLDKYNKIGGVISKYFSLRTNSIYGISTDQYIYTEYYNGNGGLVFKSYGNNSLKDLSWMDYYRENGFNVGAFGSSSPPDTVTIFQIYSNYYEYHYDPIVSTEAIVSIYTNFTQIKVGSHETNLTNYVYDIYWKNNPYTTNWEPGDSIYWYDSGGYSYSSTNYSNYDEYTNGYTNVYHYYYVYYYVSTNTYKIGYTVPSKMTYLYENYYMDNSWPMKYLLLDPAYGSGYTLVRQEGENYTANYTYYDKDYNPQTYTYSWTNYNWWLRSSVTNRQFDIITNVQYNYNTGEYDITNIYSNDLKQIYGDIQLQNVQYEDVYVWDYNSTNMLQQKGIFIYGSGDNPKYFTFTQASLKTVVDANIQYVYANNVLNFNLKAFLSNVPAMPNYSNFPPIIK